MIKAPLEELFEKESFSDRGKKRMKIALRNVDVLLRLTTNLINFERTDVYSSELFIAQYDLKSYLQDVCDTSSPSSTLQSQVKSKCLKAA